MRLTEEERRLSSEWATETLRLSPAMSGGLHKNRVVVIDGHMLGVPYPESRWGAGRRACAELTRFDERSRRGWLDISPRATRDNSAVPLDHQPPPRSSR